ncbi:MAG: VWA domain-containing protein, partial [Planctomycetes bacterium]|nr:VWA domain-containing protein [Planctomycetota bacterium]
MNPTQSRTVAAAALAVLAAGLLAGGPASAGEPGADVFFVMDGSESMRRLDPEGRRTAFVQALVDLLLSRGGDRVSVIRLGGSLETAEWTPVVLPLTEIPAEGGKREEALDAVKKALGAQAEAFGRGSDFNAAFQAGVFAEIAKAGMQRTSVVIVLSDGALEVIEGDRAPAVYVEAAKETDGRTLRDRVNAAALELFRRKVLPALSNPVLRTFVVPVAVGVPEEEGPNVLKDLAGVPGSGKVLPLGDDLLAAAAAALRPFPGADPPPW